MFNVYFSRIIITALFFIGASVCVTTNKMHSTTNNITSTASSVPSNEGQDCQIIRGNNNTFSCTPCNEGDSAEAKFCSITFCSRKLSKNCRTMNSSTVIWDVKRFVYSEPLCQCRKEIVEPSQAVQFDKDYVGVIYSPYDMHQKAWQEYDEYHMRSSMEMISLKFRNISMYGMSTIGYSDGWKEGIIDFPHPKMAAEFNKKQEMLKLSMAIGIYRKLDWRTKNVGLVEAEIKNAVHAAKLANTLFPRTVWGISIHMDYYGKPSLEEEILDVLNLVELLNESIATNDKSVRNSRGEISVGIRLWHCSSLLNDGQSHSRSNLTTNFKMAELLQKLNFLICSVPPSSNFDLNNTESAKGAGLAEAVITTIQGVRDFTAGINPHLEVIGESGIPLLKLADLDFVTNIKTFQNFWYKMADLASLLKIRIFMYEAIDEYWKTEISDGGGGNGEYYYKSYCGWWGRLQNETTSGLYFEKATGYKYDTGAISLAANSTNSWSIWGGILLALASVLLICGACLLIFKQSVTWPVEKICEENTEGGKQPEPVIATKYIDMFLEGKCPKPNDEDDTITVAWRLPYNRKFELSPDQFVIDFNHVLGTGSTGKVYKGTVDQTVPAAFKVVTGESSLTSIKSIMSEIKILSHLASHPNVMSLLGAYTAEIEKGIIYAAIEYCDLGSLESVLKHSQPTNIGTFWRTSSGTFKLKNRQNIPPGYQNADVPINYKVVEFTMKDLTLWAHDIACGMEYVAKLGVVHADLATRNILITEDRRAKITDFGLSRKLYSKLIVQFDGNSKVPWRYLSPEALRYLTFSTESDVWAFGITLWEMFSLGRIPYADKVYGPQFIEELEDSKLLTCPKYASEELGSLMTSCWKVNPKDRPSFKVLREELAKILHKYSNNN